MPARALSLRAQPWSGSRTHQSPLMGGGPHRYVLTADGIRIAVFYTKIYNRLLVPLTAANQPQAPPELRAALAAITRHVDDYATRARLPRSAVIDAMPRACRQFLLSRWSASLPGGNRRGIIAPSRRDSPAPREWRSRRRVR